MENWKKDECCRSRSCKICPSSPILSSCCNNLWSGGSVRTRVPHMRETKPQKRKRHQEKTQKVLNLQEPVQSPKPLGRCPRGPWRSLSPQAKGLQGHREVWSPWGTSPERSRSKSKFRIFCRNVRGTQRSGALDRWLREGAREDPRPLGKRPRTQLTCSYT